MGTLSVMNAVQHRNGPNARPPNSIFASSGNSGQQLLSPQLICGFSAAISCAVGFITYIKYTLNPHKALRGFGMEGVIIITAFVILPLLVGAILLITHRPRKQVLVVCVQPGVTDEEIENWVLPPGVSNTEGDPPSYDLAMTMPKMTKKRADLPPSYSNIFIV